MSIMGNEVTEEEVMFHYFVSQKLGCKVTELADMERLIRTAKEISKRVEITDRNKLMCQYMTNLYEATLALIEVHKLIMKSVGAIQKGQANAEGETIN